MRKAIVALLGTVMILTMTGCSTTSAAPDEIALLYTGGEWSSQKFQKCVQPGNRDRAGIADTYYTYPIGQRTFTFTNDTNNKDRDAPAISISTKDPLDLTVTGTATFEFVSTCEKVREFHEKIGFKYLREAESKGGGFSEAWLAMLDTYFRQDLEKAMDASAKALEWRSLYSAPDVKETWEDTVAELAPKIMEEHAEAAYFSNIRLSLDAPQPPANVIEAMRSRQVAIEENNAQKERNTKALTELEGLKACRDAIGTEACLYKYAVDRGAQVIVAPNTGVNVGAR